MSIEPSPIRPEKPQSRVVLIGSMALYRGGVAQYTTGLFGRLKERKECLGVSFSRQYPRWLFPGKSDKDETKIGYSEPGVEYLIDSLNPLTWRKAVARIREFGPSLVILPWWHVYWSICFGYLINTLKHDGIEIAVICHNAVEHEDARWKHWLRNWALAGAGRFLVHSLADQKNLQNEFPGKSVSVHPLPIADQFPQANIELPRRARLELLFFGFVRPYKGLDVLLAAMAELKNEDVYLSIVGEFWQGYEKAANFVESNQLTDQVEIVERYVSDKEAAAWFERADAVVLPYLSATGSGVVPLAYFYNKPVIASRVGGIPDVVIDGATGLLVAAGSVEHLVAAIKAAVGGITFYDPTEMTRMKAGLSWDSYLDELLDVNNS